MIASELRLGNYLRIVVNGPTETVEVIGQATGIGKDNVIMGDSPYGGGIPTPFEYLQPILLTEECLLKAGFIETYKSDYGHSFELETDSRIGVKFYLTEGRTMFRFIGETLPIQHLHHLQNLTHALIGTELTFDTITPPTE